MCVFIDKNIIDNYDNLVWASCGFHGLMYPSIKGCAGMCVVYDMWVLLLLVVVVVPSSSSSSSSSSSTQRSARRPVDEMHVLKKKRCSRLGQKQVVKSTSMQKHTLYIWSSKKQQQKKLSPRRDAPFRVFIYIMQTTLRSAAKVM